MNRGGKDELIRQEIKIQNLSGLHLRPAAVLCNKALEYQCNISINYADGTANAKSVLSVLAACVRCGDTIELICDGVDEEDAMKALTTSINHGLGE